MEKTEEKVSVPESLKSSSEILTELFSTFDAEPPLIIKKEEYAKKPKKNKKKHKHKDKKHKRKSRKRKRSHSDSSCSIEKDIQLNITKVVLKQERETPEKKIKLELSSDGDNNNLNLIKQENNEGASGNCTMDNKELINVIKTESKDQDEEGKTENSVTIEESEISQPDSKIKIQNLKFSSIFKQTILEIQEKQKTDPLHSDVNLELTDISDLSEEEIRRSKKHKHKTKHSHKSTSGHKKDRHKSENKEKHRHRSDSESRNSHHSQERSCDRKEEKGRTEKDRKHCEKDDFCDKQERKIYKENYKEDCKDKYSEKDSGRGKYSSNDLKYKKDDRKSYKEDDSWRRSYREDYSRKEDKEDDKKFYKDRYRGHDDLDKNRDYKQKVHSKSQERDYIDKKKLLEIARKNAIQMMRSGSLPAALTLGPQAQEKVLAAIRAGGKTVEELTEFCKTLSKKEELGELSSVSEDDNDSDTDRPFHHPFQIKDRPTSIIMNIKNSVPLPTKTSQERSTELRMQFPVSSGQQHRKTENEWVPVSPKKTEAPIPTIAPKTVTTTPSVVEEISTPPVVQPLAIAAPGPQVFPPPAETPVDIGMIVSQRLSAMRKLQENPNDVQAISEMYRAQREVNYAIMGTKQTAAWTIYGLNRSSNIVAGRIVFGLPGMGQKGLRGPDLVNLGLKWISYKMLLLYLVVWECIFYRKWVGDQEKV
ncbi:protein SON isoform X2 [Agrilus planipennis]|uniref:Protein SON isoform X2 n=1 Tax=Agrilus planipennis TaxID=224129 RepID=A0A1W4W2V7_AGRPL|nr:protein SON isoform X2 [Agrilus planipennis]